MKIILAEHTIILAHEDFYFEHSKPTKLTEIKSVVSIDFAAGTAKFDTNLGELTLTWAKELSQGITTVPKTFDIEDAVFETRPVVRRIDDKLHFNIDGLVFKISTLDEETGTFIPDTPVVAVADERNAKNTAVFAMQANEFILVTSTFRHDDTRYWQMRYILEDFKTIFFNQLAAKLSPESCE